LPLTRRKPDLLTHQWQSKIGALVWTHYFPQTYWQYLTASIRTGASRHLYLIKKTSHNSKLLTNNRFQV
jgi:hypothetical protein